MKILLLILFLLLTTCVLSQVDMKNSELMDSLETELVKTQNELLYVQANLKRFQKQYRTGTIITFVGAAVTIGGLITTLNTGTTDYQYLMVIGGAVGTIGYIMQIDSHKWIGKAGIGTTENGLTIKYDLNK